MKKTIILFLFFIYAMFTNAQINVNNFLGGYNCTLVQYFGSVTYTPNISVFIVGTGNNPYFEGYDYDGSSGIVLDHKIFFLNDDSSFYDTTSVSCRYGNFYKQDSIYVYICDYSGHWSKYYGKKTNSSIDEIFKTQVIQVYPNPSNSTITLELNNNCLNNNSNAVIKSILGKSVNEFKVSSSHQQIDVSTLPCGIYFIEVNTKYGILSKKLIINR